MIRPLALATALGVAVLVLLQVVLAGTYWEVSEGVYLYTARLFHDRTA